MFLQILQNSENDSMDFYEEDIDTMDLYGDYESAMTCYSMYGNIQILWPELWFCLCKI